VDCEKLDALAIDLVYDELQAREPRTAEEAAQHLVGCTRCSALIDRLREGRRAAAELPLEEPSSFLEARIFAAASGTRNVVPWPRRVVRALYTAGAYAMRPQVAMAAVLVLMVGSSVLLLRSGGSARRTKVTDEGTPVATVEREQSNTITEGQGAPAGLLKRGEEKPAATPASPSASAIANGEPGQGPKPAEEVAADVPKKSDPSSGDDFDGKADKAKVKVGGGEGKDKGSADTQAAGAIGGAKPSDLSEKEKDESTKLETKKSVASPAPPAAMPTTASGAAAAAVPTPASFDDSMTAYKEGRWASAGKGFDAAANAGTKPSTSTLYAARSFRAAGSCVQALPRFQKVLTNWATSAEAPYAAMEGGECAKATGDLATARALFEKAKGFAVTKERAEKALAELNKPPAAVAPAKPAAKSKPSMTDQGY
jgi:hypothetical protein